MNDWLYTFLTHARWEALRALGPACVVVYLELCHRDAARPGGWPGSVSQLYRAVGIGERTVTQAVLELERKGFIARSELGTKYHLTSFVVLKPQSNDGAAQSNDRGSDAEPQSNDGAAQSNDRAAQSNDRGLSVKRQSCSVNGLRQSESDLREKEEEPYSSSSDLEGGRAAPALSATLSSEGDGTRPPARPNLLDIELPGHQRQGPSAEIVQLLAAQGDDESPATRARKLIEELFRDAPEPAGRTPEERKAARRAARGERL